MEKRATALPGVVELRPTVFRDARGFFMETYHRERFAELGITGTFVQDNHSRSSRGTLRGMHYQLNHAQAKLCRVVEGEVLDVAIDIRVGSPHFGKWTSVVLNDKDHNMIYVPPGFAHGFLALSESVQFVYKCTDLYTPGDEHGVVWNDPDVDIAWGIDTPLVSEKDARYTKLSEIPRELLPRYSS